MFVDLLNAPAAAKVMTHDHVKRVTAIGAGRSSFTYNPLNKVNLVARPASIEAVTVELRRFRRSGLAAFAPGDGPVKRSIQIGQLPDGVESIAGYGENFGGATEQFCGNWLAVDLEC